MTDGLLAEYRLLIADVYELAGRSRATSESFARARGQSAARWHILSVVADDPYTVPTIAHRLGLARQSVQRVVNELAAETLVEFVANPANKRSPFVRVTVPGGNVCARLFEDSARAREQALKQTGLTSAQLQAARDTIVMLNAAMRDIAGGASDGVEETRS